MGYLDHVRCIRGDSHDNPFKPGAAIQGHCKLGLVRGFNRILRPVPPAFIHHTGGFALAVDEGMKKAYFIFGHSHFDVVTATLPDDYTGMTGEYSEHYAGLHPPFSWESPTYFARYVWLPIKWQGDKPTCWRAE